MKKILTSLLLIFVAGSAFALGPVIDASRHKIPFIEDAINRATAQASAKSPWQRQLAQLQKDFALVRHPYAVNDIPIFYNQELSYQNEQIYLKRVIALQKWMSQNAVLKGYSFAAPAGDLAELRVEKLDTLHDFFTNAPTQVVPFTQRVRPFTLSAQLGKGAGALEIWIDVPSKKVYLMSDNFYSTAKGKYGIHLK